MPELPEVHTTVTGLDKLISGLTIKDIWTDYNSPYFYGKDQIKDPKYFQKFKKAVKGAKVKSVTRKAKNILIHLNNNHTVLIHMKMTGHLMYGKYRKTTTKEKRANGESWIAVKDGPLRDPFNRFVHLVFILSNGHHVVLSDMRKFAKVTLIKDNVEKHSDIAILGKDPLNGLKDHKELLITLNQKPKGLMKQVLMDQTIVSGIGNIYSDEILWHSDVHPQRPASSITIKESKKMFDSMIKILNHSIKMGGDSMSDYRNALGEKGGYQNCHKAYRQTGKECSKKGCTGIIKRIVIGGRSTHFCNKHQQ